MDIVINLNRRQIEICEGFSYLVPLNVLFLDNKQQFSVEIPISKWFNGLN